MIHRKGYALLIVRSEKGDVNVKVVHPSGSNQAEYRRDRRDEVPDHFPEIGLFRWYLEYVQVVRISLLRICVLLLPSGWSSSSHTCHCNHRDVTLL
jgi:hypothetical protein